MKGYGGACDNPTKENVSIIQKHAVTDIAIAILRLWYKLTVWMYRYTIRDCRKKIVGTIESLVYCAYEITLCQRTHTNHTSECSLCATRKRQNAVAQTTIDNLEAQVAYLEVRLRYLEGKNIM